MRYLHVNTQIVTLPQRRDKQLIIFTLSLLFHDTVLSEPLWRSDEHVPDFGSTEGETSPSDALSDNSEAPTAKNI